MSAPSVVSSGVSPVVGRRAGLLLLGALLLRVVYLIQYARLPFLRAPIYDSVVYLRQARSIVAGQFSDAALLAFSPLYGYFLALIGGAYRVGPPIVAQLFLGIANLILVHRLVRARYGEAAAIVAALMYQGYGLLLFYETKIMSETLGLTLALLAMNVYSAPATHAAKLRFTVGAGLFVGLSILCRASLLFAAPFFALIALLPWRKDDAISLRPSLRRAAGVCLGIALIFVTNGLWNRVHSGLFVPVILVSQTVQKSTASDFGDDFAAFSRGRPGGASALDVVEQAEARLHEIAPPPSEPRPLFGVNVLGFLRGAPIKLWHTFADTEVSYDYGYFGERSELSALSILPVSFGMLAALGLLGAIHIGRRHGLRALLPELPYLLGSLATTTLFHSSSRYRLFMVLPLLVYAAVALTAPWRTPRPRFSFVAVCAVIVIGFGIKTVTYRLRAPAGWELRVAQSATVLGDRVELTRRLERAARLAGNDPAVWQRIQMFAEAGGVPMPALSSAQPASK